MTTARHESRPHLFSPRHHFGAGTDSRRLVTASPAVDLVAAYGCAREVADRQGVGRVVALGGGTGLERAFDGFAGSWVRIGHGASEAHPAPPIDWEDSGDLDRLEAALSDDAPTLFVMADLLERLLDPRPLMRLLRRLLRRNAASRLVILGLERPAAACGRLPGDEGHVRQWSHAELDAALRAVGLTIHPRDRGPAEEGLLVVELGCTQASYEDFLTGHGLPAQGTCLVIATEPAEEEPAVRAAVRPLDPDGARTLVMLDGAEAPPAGRGWLHSADFSAEEEGDRVLEAVLQLVFVYDALRVIAYPDRGGAGWRVAQARRARMLPAGVRVVAVAVGSHFHLDHLAGNMSRTRDLRIDVRERLSLELADAVHFTSRAMRDLYIDKQGLELRAEIHDGWACDRPPTALPIAALAAAPTPDAASARGALTVIVPNYNGPAHFFRDLTRGLHASSLRPQEVIVVDDCSDADGLGRLEQALGELAPVPARMLRSPVNRGPAHARNLGLAEASTPYICAHDNDNLVTPRFLAMATRILDENPDVAAVTTWMSMFKDGDGWMAEGADVPVYRHRPLGADVGLGLHVNCFGDALAVYRAEAIRAVGGWDTSILGRREDRQLFLRLTASGHKVWVLPAFGVLYRVHPTSRMRTIPEFDGWIGLGRAMPGLPYNQAYGLVRAAHTLPAGQSATLPAASELQASELQASAQVITALQARLAAIESSTSWRIASVAQRLLLRFPRWHRRIRALLAPAEAHQPLFSKDWFSLHTPVWEQVYADMKGRANLRFLEIGVFEGRSTVWLLDHVLSHPTSRIVCVDTFEGSMEHHGEAGARANIGEETLNSLHARFTHNIRPHRGRVDVRRGRSQEIVRTLAPGSFDSVYIDGSHRACDVLEDAVLSFRLLKSGGLLIFDDYEWNQFQGTLNHPKPAIDAFLALFAGQYRELHRGYQVVIQKV